MNLFRLLADRPTRINQVRKEIIFCPIAMMNHATITSCKKWSDYDDIGIQGKHPLPLTKLGEIEDAFEESNLPYIIGIVDFSNVSDNFKRIALRHTLKL